MATKQTVCDIATQAIAQRVAGDTSWTHNDVTFDLDAGGYCARFVRQCYDAALNEGEWAWAFAAPTAREMERKLRAAGLGTTNPQPGDIVALNDQSYWAGHVAIYLGAIGGVACIAENTKSGNRGRPQAPGTKISPLWAVASEVSGYYAALLSGAPDLAKWGLAVRSDNRKILGIIPVSGVHRSEGRVYYNPVKGGAIDRYPVPENIEVGNVWGLAIAWNPTGPQIAGTIYHGAMTDDPGRFYVDVTTGAPQIVGGEVAS